MADGFPSVNPKVSLQVFPKRFLWKLLEESPNEFLKEIHAIPDCFLELITGKSSDRIH